MGKYWDATIDIGLAAMKAGCVRVDLCTAEPASYAALTGVRVGQATLASANFTAPTSGASLHERKITMTATGITASPTASGIVNHLAFHNNSDTVYAVTTTTDAVVVSGETWTVPANIAFTVNAPT